MKLTAENVRTTFARSMFTDEEVATIPEAELLAAAVIGKSVVAEGVVFHPERLEAYRDDVASMLSQLPKEFQPSSEGGGGGMSFLNACMTADGDHWGEHRDIDKLMALGTALGEASLPLPREAWQVLPGSMPYISVTPTRSGAK